jgi:hypothetical protein
MITSRMAEKHRNYAKELGVNEYLASLIRRTSSPILRATQREMVH